MLVSELLLLVHNGFYALAVRLSFVCLIDRWLQSGKEGANCFGLSLSLSLSLALALSRSLLIIFFPFKSGLSILAGSD